MKQVIRGKKPLAYEVVMSRYFDSLHHIRGPAELKVVADQYLVQWPGLLFKRNPIDSGMDINECWDELTTGNPDAAILADGEPPDWDSYIHQADPKPFDNQMAVLSLVGELATMETKSSLVYVCVPCSYGKTTCMADLAHILALRALPRAGRKTIKVHLVLANEDLLKHYEQKFADKLKVADPRVKFEFLSIATFEKELKEDPKQYAKSVLVIDEGDTVLLKDVSEQLAIAQPRHVVLLSAVPKESWTGTQRLSFRNKQGKPGTYLDVKCVFPQQRQEGDGAPEPLPEDPKDIVKLAVKMSKQQAVLFYGKKSVYGACDAWAKDVATTQVASKLTTNATEFLA